MQIHEITSLRIKNKGRQRVGRGTGSGRGTTSGRGTKGQKARTGGNVPAYFEGGQKPLTQILPKKKGFRRPNRPQGLVINLKDLAKFAQAGAVTIVGLKEQGNLNGFDYVKILGDGEVSTAFNVEVQQISQVAKEKIIAAGGTVKIVE